MLPLTALAAESAVQIRREHAIRLPDAIIWATARVNDLLLVSRNTKDFDSDLDGIRLPYTI
jgi:predicted nucleic acid-binding protein